MNGGSCFFFFRVFAGFEAIPFVVVGQSTIETMANLEGLFFNYSSKIETERDDSARIERS